MTRRRRGDDRQLGLWPAMPVTPRPRRAAARPAPAPSRPAPAAPPELPPRHVCARALIEVVRRLGGTVSPIAGRLYVAPDDGADMRALRSLMHAVTHFRAELEDLVPPRPSPPVKDGQPAGPCPTCGSGGPFWRPKRKRVPLWECMTCSPIPDLSLGPCEIGYAPADAMPAPAPRPSPPASPGLQIRALRSALAWSQSGMAEMLGCSRSFLATVEQGRKRPGRAMWARFERLRDVLPGAAFRARAAGGNGGGDDAA